MPTTHGSILIKSRQSLPDAIKILQCYTIFEGDGTGLVESSANHGGGNKLALETLVESCHCQNRYLYGGAGYQNGVGPELQAGWQVYGSLCTCDRSWSPTYLSRLRLKPETEKSRKGRVPDTRGGW